MKPIAIVGLLLILGGLFVLINGASFTKDKTVLKAGPLEANVKQTQSVPPWAGGLAIAVGIGVVAVGFKKPSQ
jgi:hypothetical protein